MGWANNHLRKKKKRRQNKSSLYFFNCATLKQTDLETTVFPVLQVIFGVQMIY